MESSKPVGGLTVSVPWYSTNPAPLKLAGSHATGHVHTATWGGGRRKREGGRGVSERRKRKEGEREKGEKERTREGGRGRSLSQRPSVPWWLPVFTVL